MPLERSWRAAATILAAHRDVLDGRPAPEGVPAAIEARGWASYLLAREDAEVDLLEAQGLEAVWPSGAPDTLLELARSVRSACALPEVAPDDLTTRARRRSEKPRKKAQIDAFARLVVPLARGAERVVDVGSGHGHLTRELADRLGVPVLGLERDPSLAERARSLATEEGADGASFAVSDVLAGGGLALSRRDCVVGLHACGELGDALVEAAARAGAAIALVGCCLQKRRSASRSLLGARAGPGAELPEVERRALELPRSILGLSNLTARDEGVEASRAENLRARERRLALHRLLTEAGLELELGAEIEGQNRRAAHGPLETFVARAFALRGLRPPSPSAIAVAARLAATQHARMRRLALPRSLLARLIEVFVVLDRARHLELRGYRAEVAILFSPAVSARNIALFAPGVDELASVR